MENRGIVHKIRRAFVVSASLMSLLAVAPASPAQTFSTIFNFDVSDGDGPLAGLVQATDGNLYGTTDGGGSTGYGTVFKISTDGTLTTLYVFCSQTHCVDGAQPDAALVQGVDGNFYGTTFAGGANNHGVVFKIIPSGTLTTLYSFCSLTGCTDGYGPEAPLVQGTDGNFYGTTDEGGAIGEGTVFRITPNGALTTLYSFCSEANCADGDQPLSGLVEGADGDFYGTTYGGGANNYGTIYRITPSGTLTILHSFNQTDGAYPSAGLMHASNGSFYGATSEGGQNDAGTVFRITAAGELTTIYTFCPQGECPDGANPKAPLIQATDGSMYGTTWGGGSKNHGTAFRIGLNGSLRTLYRFCSLPNCADGSQVVAGLLQDTDGNLYGTASNGGAYGEGTVFSLSVGLGPFVETRPTFGIAGKQVEILGTNLTGTTSVTFNGTPATFTVVSPSLIKTTVPADATTGTVQVVTPGGTLKSNLPFRVIQQREAFACGDLPPL